MTHSSRLTTALTLALTLPLLLGGCSGAVDVVASDEAANEASPADVQPTGTWGLGHHLSGGGVASSDAADEGAPAPGTWQIGHAIAEEHLVTGTIEVTLAPGEARSLCHLVPVDVASTVHLLQHRMSDLPGSVQLIATAASSEAARILPAVFDCNAFSMPESAPFYEAKDAAASLRDSAGIVTLAADSAVLLRYDVANPGTDPVTATVHVVMVR
jgi:hypothetical protein